MKAEGTRTCLVCGTQFPVVNEFCPVCMLREALNKQVAESLSEGVVPSRQPRARRSGSSTMNLQPAKMVSPLS